MKDNNKKHKSGYVAIVGEPNVGKSTLLNTILNQKISITSPKPQTTRQNVVGIYNDEEAQIIFLDTPGFIKPKYLLQQEMIKNAKQAVQDADIVVMIIDITKNATNEKELLQQIISISDHKALILLLNKIDLINESVLLTKKENYLSTGVFKEVIPISATKQEYANAVIGAIKKYLPIGESYYSDDIISKQSERFFVAEFIREKIFDIYKDEIPYSCAVIVKEFKEKEEGKTFISANIYVERESQKKIIIGKGGSALKNVGIEARKDIEQFLQREIYLELYVKVRVKWRKNKYALKQFGYK